MNNQQVINTIIETVQQDPPLALHEPRFRGNEWAFVKECIDTSWVSSVGAYVDRFEEMLTDYTGVHRAAATVNGTAALHTCLVLSGVQRDDEVLIPALTFVATANAVAYCGAIPHFVDASEQTLGVDPEGLRLYLQDIVETTSAGCRNRLTGRRIAALVVMHTFGHPTDLDPLVALCEEYGIALIEDAAESLGSRYKGKHTGSIARLAALSFNGNKVITTGGGGAILSTDPELAKAAKHITTTAKAPHPWRFIHNQVGYNYRMPNINAALGCAQLETLSQFLKEKKDLARRYKKAFAAIPGVQFFSEPDFAESNYWLNTLLVDTEVDLDPFFALARDHKIQCRPAWELMPDLPMYARAPSMPLDCARSLVRRIISIPSSAGL